MSSWLVATTRPRGWRETETLPLAQPFATNSYRVFLSSGHDAVVLRDRAESLFAIATQLLVQHEAPFRIEVDRWEHTAPQRGETDHLNDLFVERAKRAHLTLVLLLSDIRPGTLQEVEAVLNETTDRDVAVIWFHEPGVDPTPELEAFLAARRDEILYAEVGPPDSEDAWYGLVRVVTRLLVNAFHPAPSLGATP